MRLNATQRRLLPVIWVSIPRWCYLIGLAAILRFVNLGSENLWYDESFTVLLAKLPLDRLWLAIRGDVHPPLWYFLEAINIRVFGLSEFTLRLPSALCGCLAVYLIYKIALRIGFTERTALVSGLLCAVLPAMLYYGQEARMYALLVCAVLGMVYFGLLERWFWFALAGAAAVYLQNLGVAYVFVIGLAILATRQRRGSFLQAGLALVGIGLAWLPWAVWGIAYQMRQMSQAFWMPPLTLGGALWPATSMIMGWRLGDVWQIHVYSAGIAVSLLGLFLSRRWLVSRTGLPVLAGLIGMPVFVAGASLLWRDVYLHRALLPSAALLMLPWAYALDTLSAPNKRIALAVVIPALAIGITAHYFPTHPRSEIKSWIEPVNQLWQPGDVIYHVALDSAILSQTYSQRPYYLLPESNDLSQSLTDETKNAIGFPMLDFDHLHSQGYQRAFFFWIDSPMVSSKELAEINRIKAEYWYRQIQDSQGDTVSSGIWLVDLWTKDLF